MKKAIDCACVLFMLVHVATAKTHINAPTGDPANNRISITGRQEPLIPVDAYYNNSRQRRDITTRSVRAFTNTEGFFRYQLLKYSQGIDSAESYYKTVRPNMMFVDYLPLTGGTLSGTLAGTSAYFSGNVGIGVGSTSQKLEIAGSTQITGGGLYVTQSTAVNSIAITNESSGSARIVTNTAVPLTLGTNNATDQLFLKSDGNVGIGTATPGQKLEVAGSTQVTGGAIYVTQSAPSNSIAIINTVSGSASITTNAAVPLVLGTNNSTDQLFLKSGGNIGIGTATPSQKLEVAGSTQINGGALYVTQSSQTNSIAIINSVSGSASITTNAAVPLVIGANNSSNQLYLTSDGKVGIGTSSPTQKLFVAGNMSADGFVTARKMTVTQLGWSDDVFNNDYKLRSLQNLDAFIKKTGIYQRFLQRKT
jgi:hypothetical protein